MLINCQFDAAKKHRLKKTQFCMQSIGKHGGYSQVP